MNLNIFQWRSLKTRMTLFTLTIFLIGIWSLAFYASRMLREDMQRLLGEQQFSTVSIIAADINTELDNRLRAIGKAAARITPAILGNAASMQVFLEDRPALESMFSGGIYVTRLNGAVIADFPTVIGRIGTNYMDREWMAEVLKGKSTIGKPVMGKTLHAPVFVVAVPIRDTKGKVIGVLAGVINLGVPNFLDKITDNRYGKTGGYLLISRQVRMIVFTTDKKRIMEVLPGPGINPPLDRFLQGYEGSAVYVNPLGVEVLGSAKGIPVSGWLVEVTLPTEEAFAPIHAMQKRMLLASIFMTLLAGGLTWWMLKRHLAPVFTTIKTLATLSDTDHPPKPLPITRQDEIGRLIGGFNHLLETLGKREEALKEAEAEMAVLADIGLLIGSTLDIDEVYGRFAAEIQKLIPFDSLTINLYNFQENTMCAAYVSGLDIDGRRKGDPLVPGGSLSEAVIHSRTGLRIQPASFDEIVGQFPRLSPVFQAGLRSIMCVPLVSRDEVIGVLHIRSKKQTAYSEQDLRLADRIGMQIAGAIANAEMFNVLSKAERSLRASNELFSLFMSHSPIYTYIKEVTPTQSVVLQASDNYRQMIGIPGSEMAGKTMTELFPPELAAKITADDWAVVSRGDVLRLDEELNGRSYTTIKFPVVQGDKTLLAGYTIDITDRKQAEEEKQSLEERLNRSEKMEALGTLAGGVAHDLNNVLGVIVGYSEMLLDGVDKSSHLRHGLENVMNGGLKAAAIVDDLLTLARRGVPGRSILNLNKIIADCQKSPEFANLSFHHPSVKIKTDIDPDLLNISGSSVHLGKSLYNLVSNASEAMTKGGGVTIKTSNQYLDKPIQGYDQIRAGDYVVLSVSDTGEGISANDLKRIFEPFYTKKVMGRSGTGLGLAVVWGTVKDHNGYINVESEEGRGSTFTLYFPVTREDITDESVAIAISEYMGSGESILVVDDVKEQRDLAAGMLRTLNYNVSSISSGEEAVAYMKEHEVDLMVLDMIMDPGMDGLDTYKNALTIHPQQKAIIVSGFSESDRVKTAEGLGAGAYVRKPYIKEKLGLAVRKELDRDVRR